MERLRRYLKDYHIDRLAWCLFIAAFCWTDVADFYHMTYNKQLCLWVMLGGYYLYKQAFWKEKGLFLWSFGIAGMISAFLIGTNFFSGYYYYNYTISAWLFVAVPQYGILLHNIWKEKKLPGLSMTTVLLFLMFFFAGISVNEDKRGYVMLLFILFPYACMDFEKQERRDIWLGVIDGICLGFLVCQGYTFLFKQYTVGTGYRFKGYRSVIAYGGMSYMLFYIGFFMKYILYVEQKEKKWKRVSTFLLAAFCVALLYLTGSRSAAIGVGLSTAVLVLWLYRKEHWKTLLLHWTIKCVSIAMCSILLFPAAYAGTSYLPRILQHPDLQDSVGNRIYSFSHTVLKQTYLYDSEWSEWSAKANEPRNSYKYIKFYECMDATICRVIPGLDRLVLPFIQDKVFEQRAMHYLYGYEEGIVSLASVRTFLHLYATQYQQDGIPDDMLDFMDKITEQRESAKQENIGQNQGTGSDQAAGVNLTVKNDDAKLVKVVAVNSRAVAAPRILLADSKVTEQEEAVACQRGDSVDYGWFESGESYSAMQLRSAIHQYTVGKLNFTGHEAGTYQFYYRTGLDKSLPHGHNIFLVTGYDYGIPAMALMLLLFASLCYAGWSCADHQNNACYLLAPALALAFTGYGWFEYGFGPGNALSTLLFLCAILLKSKRRY